MFTVACTGSLTDEARGASEPVGPTDDDSPIEGVEPVDAPASFVPTAPLVRRLTKPQYQHTIEDRLGIALTTEELSGLPSDRPLEGFSNIATSQAMEPAYVRAYADLAGTIAARLDLSNLGQQLAACNDDSPACALAFGRAFAERMFRRPLTVSEETRIDALATSLQAEADGFEELASFVVEFVLQSPQFLYRPEVEVVGEAGLRRVTGYEMATRLSFAVWNSAPDDALLEAARSGALDSDAGIAAEVHRMLQDHDKTRRVSGRFMADWARLENLPDPDGLRADLIASAIATFDESTWSRGQSLLEMLTATTQVLTPSLATRAGLEASSEPLAEYDTGSLKGHAGLLTHPGVIAGMTNADGGEIVARGLFMLSAFYCQEIPPPPASLQTSIDEFVAALSETASHREVAEARLERTQCGPACHSNFDPLGFAFEHFDFRGAYRQTDEHGNALRSDGWVPALLAPGGQAQPYQEVGEYAALITGSDRVQTCWRMKLAEHVLGAKLEDSQADWVFEHNDQDNYGAFLRQFTTDTLFTSLEVQ